MGKSKALHYDCYINGSWGPIALSTDRPLTVEEMENIHPGFRDPVPRNESEDISKTVRGEIQEIEASLKEMGVSVVKTWSRWL